MRGHGVVGCGRWRGEVCALTILFWECCVVLSWGGRWFEMRCARWRSGEVWYEVSEPCRVPSRDVEPAWQVDLMFYFWSVRLEMEMGI